MKLRFAAAGDIIPQRHIPENDIGVKPIQEWMAGCDAKYFNLEATVHRENEGCFGSQFNGGSYLRAEPEYLEDCKRYGFNMVSFCNNHSLDFSYDGFVKTLQYVKSSGLVQAGSGMNMDEAAAPAYVDTKNGRIALIGITNSGNPTGIAGKQSRRMKGRPGVNMIRNSQTLLVTPEEMAMLRKLAEKTNVNVTVDADRRDGYLPMLPDNELEIGNVKFREAESEGLERKCNKKDLERTAKAIYEAKMQSDYILMGVHAHKGGADMEDPGDYLEEYAHFCIDSGADAVVCHGPHQLRPVEIYKGKPIFYSLGNFVFMNENSPYSPEEYYNTYGLTSDDTMRDLYTKRSRNFTTGLYTKKVMFETVLPRWEVTDGKLTKLELLPIELTFGSHAQGGVPHVAEGDAILRRLEAMSARYGTKFAIEGNAASVILPD